MDIETDVIYGIAVGVAIPLLLWALNKWKTINADGVITPEEAIETIIEGLDAIGDAAEVIEELTREGDGE